MINRIEKTDRFKLNSFPRLSASVQGELETTSFDRTHGFLWSANMIIGLQVTLLLLIWFSLISAVPRKSPPPPEPPGHDTTIEVSHSMPSSADEIQPEDFPEATIQDFSRVLAALPIAVTLGADKFGFDGIGIDPRKPSPILGGVNNNHWSIEIRAANYERYLQILDKLEIEIGIVMQDNEKIVRLSNLSGNNVPSIRNTTRKNEKRTFYFSHRNAKLRNWDKQLARNANLSFKNAIWVHFYPTELIQKMGIIEAEVAALSGRTVKEVRQTNFTVSMTVDAADQGQIVFDVVDMSFHK